MTARLALIALTGWALAAPAAAEDYKLEDVLVSGLHQGRAVATGRTDSRGAFRLEFPAGPSAADQICFTGYPSGPNPDENSHPSCGSIVSKQLAHLR